MTINHRFFPARDAAPPDRSFARARRRAMLAALAGLAPLAGCAGAPLPPITWLRLGADANPVPVVGSSGVGGAAGSAGSAGSVGAVGAVGAREVWQLLLPLPLPAYLDRDSLFVPQGTAGALVRPLAGARWVEPLRDAVPRLLREDLIRRMGGQVLWWSPLPPGVQPTRQLRVELTAFEIGPAGLTLLTRARWSIADTRAARPPLVHEAAFEVPATRIDDAESWALAHRQAIAMLAARIAATLDAP